jgi:hypothetical protein
MALFGSPAPQWTDLKSSAAVAKRLVPVLDASGFWVFPEGLEPDGALVDDPSGFSVIDDTTTAGLKATLLPSGYVIAY